MTSNPFNYWDPVIGEQFIGRKEEVEKVARELAELRRSCAIVGGRKCGKTSFLKTLQDILLKRLAQAQSRRLHILPVFVNLRDLSQYSIGGVFALMLNTLYDYFHSPLQRQTLNLTLEFDLSGTQLEAFVQNNAQECPLNCFTKMLEELILNFFNVHGLLRIVFLLDETGKILEQLWARDLFSQLRSLIDGEKLRQYLCFVIAGSSKLREKDEQGSPLWNVNEPVYLTSLKDESILEILHQVTTVPDDFATAVLQLCKGHPYLAQYVMYYSWESLQQGSVLALYEIENRFRIEHMSDLAQWKADLGEAGLLVYDVLITANDWLSEPEIKRLIHDQAMRPKVTSALTNLWSHSLIILDGTWSKYRVAGALFKNWFAENARPSLSTHLQPNKPSLAAPSGVTDFVIITALREELEAILEKLPSYQQLPPANEDVRVYYQADLPVIFSDGVASTYRLILLSLLGMGRVQAANAVNDAVRRWHPRYILLLGIAGGIAEAKVKRGDVLISDQVVDYELQKLTETGPQIRWEVHRADPRLLEAARNLGNNWRKLIKKRRPQKGIAERLIGPVATGDKVIAMKEAIEQLRKDWPKLIGIEMEAGGAASAAFQAAQPPGFLMIRGVSDLADENKDDTWRLYACHTAAAYAITLLQSGPITPSMQKNAGNQGSENTSSNKQIINSPSFKPTKPQPVGLKIPEMGDHFLNRNRQDREYLINIINTTIDSISTVDGIKNLLRGKLPDPQINRINFREGSRNIAESIIGNLEPRGVLNPPRYHYHALGAFLNDLIEDEAVSYDAAVKIVALLFRYTLITDRRQVIKLSAHFQVPSPLLTEEGLINHPPSPASLPSTIKIPDLQERFESLYNRRRYLLDVKFLSQGAKAANSVCRIDFDKRGEGTGFLVAPDLILTNYHVMLPPGYKGDPNIRARKCEIKFGVIEGLSAGTRFTLDNNKWLIEQSRPEDLDFMLLRLNRPVTVNDQVWPLSLESNSVELDEFVNIIQHPNGGSMEVSIRFNQVVAVEDNRIYYLADTEEGSSGSPVFNDSWGLVALHHSGGKLDGSGNLTVAANIGVPINAIREQIAVYLNN